MLTSDSHCWRGAKVCWEKECLWEESKFIPACRWLREVEGKGVMGEVLLHLSLNLFNSIFHHFIFSLKELNPIPII